MSLATLNSAPDASMYRWYSRGEDETDAAERTRQPWRRSSSLGPSPLSASSRSAPVRRGCRRTFTRLGQYAYRAARDA
jgi:hypothetical protein